MHFTKAITYPLLLLTLLLDLTVAVYLHVYRDTSCPNFIGQPDSVYLWSAVATFAREPENGEIVSLAEDAWKSMYKAVRRYNVPSNRLPTVMSALAAQNDNGVWEIYFASSSKGTSSLVYTYGEASEYACGDKWDTVPREMRDAIDQCSASSGAERHRFDAKCGEMNAFLELFMRTGQDVSAIAGRSKIVAWQGKVDENGEYVGGFIKDPCWIEGGFGCSDVLRALSASIEVIPKRTRKLSYTEKMLVSVDFQPLFPGYESV